MDINLTPKFKQKMGGYPRTRGRYNSSELYSILVGFGKKLTPEKWLHPDQRTLEEMFTMWNGTGVHNQIQNIIGEEHCEKKVVFSYKDICIVAKADILPEDHPNEVWELKTSERTMKEAKDYQLHQVRLYCTFFEKPEGVIYQPVKNKNGIYLREIGRVKRDDKWVEEQLKALYEFHKRVEPLWQNQ